MDRSEIRAQLRDLPIEASVALAVRAALRLLPLLVRLKDRQIFLGWPEKICVGNMQTMWLTYDIGLLVVCDKRLAGLKEFTSASRTTNAAAATNYPAAATAAYAAAAATATAANAVANDAAAAAATAASAAYGVVAEYNLSLQNDFEILRKNNPLALINSPLWKSAPPTQWVQQLAQFQTALRTLDSGFDFWLDWYDARCRGDAVDVDLLKQRVFLPQSIASQDIKKVNAYLASLTQGLAGAPLNRVRTIFIGDGEAGKTSLIRVLHGEPVVEGIEAKTPGIEIREWKIPKTNITASFWDFGGQVMVHATHQLFLRESCLYVLLVSSREKEKATERAEYWLEHVKSFGKGAPVLIVANKADKEPVRLDESLLMEKYPGMIGGFFQLSCTEVKGEFRSQFTQFKRVFCQQLQAVGLHQVQFMKPHFAVLQRLREYTPSQAFLTHADYNTLCDAQKVDAHGALDRHWLLDILDKLGVIVHFPDMIEMDEYILNPRWLTYGIYTLMYNEQAHITRAQANPPKLRNWCAFK